MTQRMCPTEVGARESSLPILGQKRCLPRIGGTSLNRDNGDRFTICGLLLPLELAGHSGEGVRRSEPRFRFGDCYPFLNGTPRPSGGPSPAHPSTCIRSRVMPKRSSAASASSALRLARRRFVLLHRFGGSLWLSSSYAETAPFSESARLGNVTSVAPFAAIGVKL
jgi:hypothetical protein